MINSASDWITNPASSRPCLPSLSTVKSVTFIQGHRRDGKTAILWCSIRSKRREWAYVACARSCHQELLVNYNSFISFIHFCGEGTYQGSRYRPICQLPKKQPRNTPRYKSSHGGRGLGSNIPARQQSGNNSLARSQPVLSKNVREKDLYHRWH